MALPLFAFHFSKLFSSYANFKMGFAELAWKSDFFQFIIFKFRVRRIDFEIKMQK